MRNGKRTESQIEKRVCALYKKGLSAYQICKGWGKEFKISKTTVERILVRNNVKIRTRAESMKIWHKVVKKSFKLKDWQTW
jgi:hypothetical protein